jgi:hypothetical protein
MEHFRIILILLDRYFNRQPCFDKPIFAVWTLLWLLQSWTWSCDRYIECHLTNFARPTNWVFGFQGTLVFLIVIFSNNCYAIICKQFFLSFVIMGFTNFVKRTYLEVILYYLNKTIITWWMMKLWTQSSFLIKTSCWIKFNIAFLQRFGEQSRSMIKRHIFEKFRAWSCLKSLPLKSNRAYIKGAKQFEWLLKCWNPRKKRRCWINSGAKN